MTAGSVRVRATATRWADDHQPGWIEVVIRGADGRDHRVVEKVPVLTVLDLRADSDYPVQLWLSATATVVETDGVRVVLDHGVDTVEGRREIVVPAADVVWH